MVNPFKYPERPHERRHGPSGYSDHSGYREWLRDEFNFSCVYSLLRETWGDMGDMEFEIDHVVPVGLREPRVKQP